MDPVGTLPSTISSQKTLPILESAYAANFSYRFKQLGLPATRGTSFIAASNGPEKLLIWKDSWNATCTTHSVGAPKPIALSAVLTEMGDSFLNKFDQDPNELRVSSEKDRMALEELFVPHMPRLYHAAARVLRHPQDSEDALQDGLLAAFCHLHQFQGRSKFSTWLHRIVVNAALMKLRRRENEFTIASTDEEFGDYDSNRAVVYPDQRQTPEERYADVECSRILSNGIQELPRRYRVVLELCDVEGLMEKEAAEKLRMPVHSVKSRRFRGRRMLLRRLRRRSVQGELNALRSRERVL